jgi:heterodisulfide reductase subunit C2
MSIKNTIGRNSLAEELFEVTGESVARCYQCGKCSAGCPLATESEHPPSQLLRLLQLRDPALDERALRSLTIWLCLTCNTCSARCPQEVDLPKIMDFLRERSYHSQMVNPRARDIVSFHRAFLGAVRSTGRLFELGMIADYKRRSLKFLQDVKLAPRLLIRGKLGLVPHRVKNRAELKRIFDQAMQRREGSA